MSSDAHAQDAPAATSLYPPRDKQTRKLWDSLCKFRKATARPASARTPTELALPAQSSYIRACIYSYAERLGLRATKTESGEGGRRQLGVLVTLPPPPPPAAGGGRVAEAAGAKRKRDEAAPGPDAAPDASSAPVDSSGAAEQPAPAEAPPPPNADAAAQAPPPTELRFDRRESSKEQQIQWPGPYDFVHHTKVSKLITFM